MTKSIRALLMGAALTGLVAGTSMAAAAQIAPRSWFSLGRWHSAWTGKPVRA